jgi:hypothetical protein
VVATGRVELSYEPSAGKGWEPLSPRAAMIELVPSGARWRAMARAALRSAIHAGREAGISDRELIQMLRTDNTNVYSGVLTRTCRADTVCPVNLSATVSPACSLDANEGERTQTGSGQRAGDLSAVRIGYPMRLPSRRTYLKSFEIECAGDSRRGASGV